MEAICLNAGLSHMLKRRSSFEPSTVQNIFKVFTVLLYSELLQYSLARWNKVEM